MINKQNEEKLQKVSGGDRSLGEKIDYEYGALKNDLTELLTLQSQYDQLNTAYNDLLSNKNCLTEEEIASGMKEIDRTASELVTKTNSLLKMLKDRSFEINHHW